MKYAIHTILFLLLANLYGCGSYKDNMDKTIQESTTETKKKISAEKIFVNQSFLDVHSSTAQTNIDEDITTIFFDSIGNIRAIQSTKRTTGRNELENSTRRSDDVSVTEKNDSIDTHSETNIESNEHRESEGDSRPVQGFSEWFAVIFSIIVAVAIVVGIIIYKIKKK
ncbi:MAG: hypothetical protein E6772_07205 [Dysgonomonas sp.]|nr:hypothetical protein [Dysgonomonas sp.]